MFDLNGYAEALKEELDEIRRNPDSDVLTLSIVDDNYGVWYRADRDGNYDSAVIAIAGGGPYVSVDTGRKVVSEWSLIVGRKSVPLSRSVCNELDYWFKKKFGQIYYDYHGNLEEMDKDDWIEEILPSRSTTAKKKTASKNKRKVRR